MHSFDDDSASMAKVTAKHASANHVATSANPRASTGETKLLHLQRTVGNAGVAQLLGSDDDPHGLQRVINGGGAPLGPETRSSMENAFNTDFSNVRVHTGSEAERSAKSLGAHAYTAGNNVVFGTGAFDPSSSTGQRTLAHELTHVVQQRSGPIDGTPTSTGIKLSDPSDRFERAAEANADRIVSAQAMRDPGSNPTLTPTPVQRDADSDEVQGLFVQREVEAEEEQEEVQGYFVQREEAPEEEEEAAV